MEQIQPPKRSPRVPLKTEPHHRKQTHVKRYHGPKFGYRSCFRNYYPMTRNWGHLRSSVIKSSLLPCQKVILAMSRAQFLAYLRSSSSSVDAMQAMSVSERIGDKNGFRDGTCIPIAMGNKDRIENIGPVDKLSVGVCIFRLDRETLRPAALLLRRSPRWWRRRVFTSAARRQAAGEWELPGGKVEDDDFCISAAIERLVREKIGLRVTKIMVMLASVRWRADLKVLRWPEDEKDGACKGSTEEDVEDEDEDDDDDDESEERTQVDSEVDMDVHMDWIFASESTSTAPTEKGDMAESTGMKEGQHENEQQKILQPSRLHKMDIQGIRRLMNSLSSSSSSATLTPDSTSASASVPPPPSPLPKDHDPDHSHRYDDRYSSDNAYQYTYHHDPDHDPSLEPAPLSLPPRTAPPTTKTATRGEGDKTKTLRRRNTASSTALPPYLHSLCDVGCGSTWTSDSDSDNNTANIKNNKKKKKERRRDAQMIPYKTVRKEHAQLNFGVLVHEDGDTNHVPRFLAGAYGGNRKNKYGRRGGKGERAGEGEGGGGREEVHEHDALEWATSARLEKMPMSEDLRQVVFEGLAWMGELTARCF
ncbi:hypothetical protein F5Y09DRAFT_34983 [Xylaria sp. FL1042]|nr:hypothetical protein F5Y09DRAFT_34983 [Xylaria sp. FL1042]